MDELPTVDQLEREIAGLWLRLGRVLADFTSECGEWIDTEKNADTAIAFTERAETCLRNAATVIINLQTTPPLTPEGD